MHDMTQLYTRYLRLVSSLTVHPSLSFTPWAGEFTNKTALLPTIIEFEIHWHVNVVSSRQYRYNFSIASEAVQVAIGDEVPREYVSVVDFNGLPVNENLPGYMPLGRRNPQAQQFMEEVGITEDHFPAYPEGSGLNISFFQAISDIISRVPCLNVTEVNFLTLNKVGSMTQIAVQHPSVEVHEMNINSGITALQYPSSPIPKNIPYFFCPQLLEENRLVGQTDAWCCITFNQSVRIPQAWIENRNERRLGLPAVHRESRFRAAK